LLNVCNAIMQKNYAHKFNCKYFSGDEFTIVNITSFEDINNIKGIGLSKYNLFSAHLSKIIINHT